MIRCGIAGVQHPHINTFLDECTRRDDVELVGIAERDPDRRAEYVERYSATPFEDHQQLLDAGNLDAVGIGDVFGDRGQIAIDALNAGVHVLADKPLCTTRADLDAIHAAWQRSGRFLSVAFEKRFYPSTLAAKQILDAGDLGELTLVTATGPHKLLRGGRPAWFFEEKSYGGILNDLTVHDADLLLDFTGGRRGEVTGRTGNYGNTDYPGFEDVGLATVRVDGGPIAALDAHWMSPEAASYHGDYRMRLVGTQGTAELLWKDDQLIVGTHSEAPREMPLPSRLRPAEDFFTALAEGRDPVISAAASFAATSLALAAQESARNGSTVPWDVTAYWS